MFLPQKHARGAGICQSLECQPRLPHFGPSTLSNLVFSHVRVSVSFVGFWGFGRFSQYRRQQQESSRGRNLYVKRIPREMSDEGLKDLFSRFGEITSAKVRFGETLFRYIK